jgi:hypothetical protein
MTRADHEKIQIILGLTVDFGGLRTRLGGLKSIVEMLPGRGAIRRADPDAADTITECHQRHNGGLNNLFMVVHGIIPENMIRLTDHHYDCALRNCQYLMIIICVPNKAFDLIKQSFSGSHCDR